MRRGVRPAEVRILVHLMSNAPLYMRTMGSRLDYPRVITATAIELPLLALIRGLPVLKPANDVPETESFT